MNKNKYDVIIIGGGPGGMSAAFEARKYNLKVALIEKERLGGTSYNWGTIPTKNLLYKMRTVDKIKNLPGIDAKKVTFDWQALKHDALEMGQAESKILHDQILDEGVHLIFGDAKVYDAHTVSVEGEVLLTDKLILAQGSLYGRLASMVKRNHLYDPKSIYKIKELPNAITIIGAGIIGFEFANLFSSMGVKVHLVDRKRPFLPFVDREIKQTLQERLLQNDVSFYPGVTAKIRSNEIYFLGEDGEEAIPNDIILDCTSREGNLEGLKNLIEDGLEIRNTFIKTNHHCQTSLQDVYAVGDINGKIKQIKIATQEGQSAISHIMGKKQPVCYDTVFRTIYTYPEICFIGLSQKLAEEQGFLTQTITYDLTSNVKALTDHHYPGYIKEIREKESGEILGIHMIGENVGDYATEMAYRLDMDDLAPVSNSIRHHPMLVTSLQRIKKRG